MISGTLILNPLQKTLKNCSSTQAVFSLAPESTIKELSACFASPAAEELLLYFHKIIKPGQCSKLQIQLQLKNKDQVLLLLITGSYHEKHYIFHYTEQSIERTTLQNEVALLRIVFNQIPEPIFIKDDRHRWLMLNDAMCSLMGVQRQDYIGKSDYDLFPKAEAEHFWRKDNEVFMSNQSIEVKEQLTNSNNEIRTILTKKVASQLPNGGLLLIGIIRDIT